MLTRLHKLKSEKKKWWFWTSVYWFLHCLHLSASVLSRWLGLSACLGLSWEFSQNDIAFSLTEPLKYIYLSLQDRAVQISDIGADKFNPHKNNKHWISIVKPKVLILATVTKAGRQGCKLHRRCLKISLEYVFTDIISVQLNKVQPKSLPWIFRSVRLRTGIWIHLLLLAFPESCRWSSSDFNCGSKNNLPWSWLECRLFYYLRQNLYSLPYSLDIGLAG